MTAAQPADAGLDSQEREQQQLLRPRDLNRQSNRSATRLELFFDLVFVLFIARCADLLATHETAAGAARFVGLMTVGWWAWASAALYANRFDTDDVVFRLLTLVGMAGVAAMAAGVGEVSGPTGRWFALGYVLLRVALVAGYLRAWHHVPSARPGIAPYLVGHAVGGAIWLTSAAAPAPARYVLWAAGIGVDLVGPAVAARRDHAVPLHTEHLPDRFALFVILVLGESVAAIVTGTHASEWHPRSTLVAALAFLLAAALWWFYFDFAGGTAKRRLLEEEASGGTRRVHDVYVYLPIALGLAAVAVGLEQAVAHGDEPHLETGARAALGIGLAVYLAATGLLQAAMAEHPTTALWWPGSGVPLVLLAAALIGSAPLLLGVLSAILVAGLAVGVAEHRAGWVHTAKV